jgi:predicted permease
MLDILTTTTPIYLAIAVGYLATRFGLFDKAGLRAALLSTTILSFFSLNGLLMLLGNH